ncbi:cytidylyltransferase domain-containing protein [Methanoregula sp.]|uniref:acylneuraminate cytidylyltransferase family protein n=1 Tax=Methanoregula sp. TaxID=2052170 RepID=UPI003C765DE6
MILGVIPARGGSKGIPRKNIRQICGKPLIAWTIEATRESAYLDRFVVSTEDPEIAGISRAYHAEVADRPAYLATDEATTLSVLQDILLKIDADIVVLLQCTSPVRTPDLIDQCIEKFRKTGADAVATGYLCSLFEWGTYSARRQDLHPYFHDDGNVYVINADNILNGDLFAGKRETVITDRECSFEIDDLFDFWLNEQILMKRNPGIVP